MKGAKIKIMVYEVCEYIWMKYNPVKRDLFESEENYFAQMVENWITAKRCGLMSDGVGFRTRY